MKRKRAVFIDRDGTINRLVDRGEHNVVHGKNIRYTAPWKLEEFSLLEGVPSALSRLREAGYLLIVVTNQPDMAYGLLKPETHEKILMKLRELSLDDVFVCPHGRSDGCECKKPKPGLLLEAQKKWDLELAESFMLGDMDTDMVAGESAGCTTILVPSVATAESARAHHSAGSLEEAVDIILKYSRRDTM